MLIWDAFGKVLLYCISLQEEEISKLPTFPQACAHSSNLKLAIHDKGDS